jgi:hypothetical protein
MDTGIETLMERLSLTDDTARYEALKALLEITERPVEWYGRYREVLEAKLVHPNSYQRSIGVMLLCNLAKNDTGGGFLETLGKMLPLVRDEKFITRRQCIQNLWKAAVVNPEYGRLVVERLESEFDACAGEKNYSLLRQDILSSLAALANAAGNEELRKKIAGMIGREEDEKNRKKYANLLGMK